MCPFILTVYAIGLSDIDNQPCEAMSTTQNSIMGLRPCKPLQIRVRYGETLIGTEQAGSPLQRVPWCLTFPTSRLAGGRIIYFGQLYRYNQRKLHQLFGLDFTSCFTFCCI